MEFEYTVVLQCATRTEADQVMTERLDHDEDYGFGYQIVWDRKENM